MEMWDLGRAGAGRRGDLVLGLQTAARLGRRKVPRSETSPGGRCLLSHCSPPCSAPGVQLWAPTSHPRGTHGCCPGASLCPLQEPQPAPAGARLPPSAAPTDALLRPSLATSCPSTTSRHRRGCFGPEMAGSPSVPIAGGSPPAQAPHPPQPRRGARRDRDPLRHPAGPSGEAEGCPSPPRPSHKSCPHFQQALEADLIPISFS